MGTRKISILLFCLAFIGISGNCQHDSLRQELIDTYTAEIGVREETGSNDGEAVEKYLSSTGLGQGYAWCAAFVNWCHVSCGITTVNAPAWSPSWFADRYIIYKRDNTIRAVPQSGDVFGIWYANKKRVAHVGFIDNWNNGSKFCTTVEGNTNKAGSREGDGVYRKKRLKRQIYAVARYY